MFFQRIAPPTQSNRANPQKPNEIAKIQPNHIKSNLTQSKSIALLFPGHSHARKFLHSSFSLLHSPIGSDPIAPHRT
jgi:hypothetical protein